MISTSLAGRSILIAEDEPLIALDVAAICEAAGASTMAASTVRKALRLAETKGLSAAVIDFAFPDGEADELRACLTQRGVPYVLYSGYTYPEGAVADALVVQKPATHEQLVGALVQVMNERATKPLA